MDGAAGMGGHKNLRQCLVPCGRKEETLLEVTAEELLSLPHERIHQDRILENIHSRCRLVGYPARSPDASA